MFTGPHIFLDGLIFASKMKNKIVYFFFWYMAMWRQRRIRKPKIKDTYSDLRSS